MTDEPELSEISKKGKQLEKSALKLSRSHEEAIGALEVAKFLLTRSASQYDVLQGSHLGSGKNE